MYNISMKKIRKVIIPAAGWGTRFLPLTKVVHKELLPILNKPIIHYLVEEASGAGIEELILVISERKRDIASYFIQNKELEEELTLKNKVELLHIAQSTNNLIKVTIVIQDEQLGLGNAIYVAHKETGDEPFAVILGDDLIKSKVPAIKQLIDLYNKTGSSVLGVQSIDEENIHKYGVMSPLNPDEKNNKSFKINGAVEKPAAKDAPSNKAALGRYIFTPEIMPLLKNLKPRVGGEINVVDAFDELLKTQDIYALEFEGTRYDLGSTEGFVKANIDYSLDDPLIKAKIREHIKNK